MVKVAKTYSPLSPFPPPVSKWEAEKQDERSKRVIDADKQLPQNLPSVQL